MPCGVPAQSYPISDKCYPRQGNILEVVLANNNDIVTRPRIHDAVQSPVDTDHHMISFDLSLSQTKSPSKKPVIVC